MDRHRPRFPHATHSLNIQGRHSAGHFSFGSDLEFVLPTTSDGLPFANRE